MAKAKGRKKKKSGKLSEKDKWMKGCMAILGALFIFLMIAIIYSLTTR